jgi:hypothetical protein
VVGFSLLSFVRSSYNAFFFVTLKPWDQRKTRAQQFQEIKVPLSKWLTAMWQIVNCRNGISSYEVHRAIGITQKGKRAHRPKLRFGLPDLDQAKAGVPQERVLRLGKESHDIAAI